LNGLIHIHSDLVLLLNGRHRFIILRSLYLRINTLDVLLTYHLSLHLDFMGYCLVLTHAFVFNFLLLLKPTPFFVYFLRLLYLILDIIWFWRHIKFFEFWTQLFILVFKEILNVARLIFMNDIIINCIFLHFLLCLFHQIRVIILIDNLILIRRLSLVGAIGLFHLIKNALNILFIQVCEISLDVIFGIFWLRL